MTYKQYDFISKDENKFVQNTSNKQNALSNKVQK